MFEHENTMNSGRSTGTPRRRTSRGAQMAEAVLAAFILIPLTLGMLDLFVVVLANSMNDTAVKNAARAAANQDNGADAFNAAKQALQSFKSSSIVQSIEIDIFTYPADKSEVTCQTIMRVHLPVPIPGASDVVFKAKDVEPIVGAKK